MFLEVFLGTLLKNIPKKIRLVNVFSHKKFFLSYNIIMIKRILHMQNLERMIKNGIEDNYLTFRI